MNTKDGNQLIRVFIEHGHLSIRYDYNKDWNALMQVIDKIETIKLQCDKSITTGNESYLHFGVVIYNRCCDVQYKNKVDDNIIEITAYPSKIEAVWEAVVQFIQWYNKKLNND